MKHKSFVVLLMIVSLGQISRSQTIGATSWTRVGFEAGVTYGPSDQIGNTTTTCPPYGWAADWYAHSVSWKTSAPSAPTTNGAVPKTVQYNGAMRTVVFNGTYPVYANNQTYDTSLIGQTTTATITLRLHCLDGTYPYIDLPATQQVTIYDRIPIDKVVVPTTAVTGGQTFNIEIVLTAPAQPSNTRVDLTWSGNGLNLIGSAPNHVDISAPATSITLTVPTEKNTGAPKQVKVTAATKTSQTATVTIK